MSDDIQVLKLVQKELHSLREDQIRFLANGSAKTFDEYQKICGVIRGLNLADSFTNDLVRKITNDD
jgi:hypothetical protein